MMLDVVTPQYGSPYLTNLPDVPNVSPEWEAEMQRLFATMEDDEVSPTISVKQPPPPPISHVRQCIPQGGTTGERGSHLPGTETATSAIKAG